MSEEPLIGLGDIIKNIQCMNRLRHPLPQKNALVKQNQIDRDFQKSCFYYQQGNCKYGKYCKYKHENTINQPIRSLPTVNRSIPEIEPIVNYVVGANGCVFYNVDKSNTKIDSQQEENSAEELLRECFNCLRLPTGR